MKNSFEIDCNDFSSFIDFFFSHGYRIALYGEFEFYSKKNFDNIEDLNTLFSQFSYNIRYIYREDGLNQFEIVSEITTDIHDFIYFFSSIRRYINSLGFLTDAKPFLNRPANSFQINITLVKEENSIPIFRERTTLGDNIINSICINAIKWFLYYAPNISSYKRFQYYDRNTPTTFSWGIENKSVAVKLKKMIGFLEFRLCGSDAIIDKSLYSILYFIKLAFSTTFPKVEQSFYFNDPFKPNKHQFSRVPFSYTEAIRRANMDFN